MKVLKSTQGCFYILELFHGVETNLFSNATRKINFPGLPVTQLQNNNINE